MNRRWTVLVVGLSVVMALSGLTQSLAIRDFSGTWRLDVTKTVMTGGPVRVDGPGTASPMGQITSPVKITHVSPIYPPDAMRDRVEGIVIIDAILSADGSVVGAQVLRSVPDLDQAALGAVEQWKFTPATLNGVPVSAVMTVTVNFRLGSPGSSTRGSAPAMPAMPTMPLPPTPGSRSGAGRGGGLGANALGDGPGLFAPNQEMTITQSLDALVIVRSVGEATETLTYRLDGSPSRNQQLGQGGGAAGEYVSVSRWAGATLMTETTGPDGAGDKRIESRALDGDQLMLDTVKTVAGIDPWRTKQVFTRIRK
jgi:TonB family protein